MSSVSINSRKVSRGIKSSFWDGLAKKTVIKALNNISKGRLVIQEDNKVNEFGEPAEKAEIIAHIFIDHPSAYKDILFGGSIGAAEAYMLGTWRSSSLVDVIRLMAVNLDMLNKMDSSRPILNRIVSKLSHLMNANTQSGSQKNISAHYDLGNDFFKLFLDPTMMYSSAIYPSEDATLDEASIYKLDTICKKLNLSDKDHLLEVGTGWGGLAIHAAKHYGCDVTTTTISKEQYDYACAAVKKAGVENTITVLLKDYRDLDGKYNKLVSVEMIEAVGHEYYDDYFSKCSSLLESDGVMLIQAITIADQRYEYARKNVDFIQRYIFPGGCLPSNEVVAKCIAKKTDMMIVSLHDIGLDYAKTLADWRQRFHEEIDAVKDMGFDDVFCRLWEFYLCYCEGGFSERSISAAQFVCAKPGARTLVSAS